MQAGPYVWFLLLATTIALLPLYSGTLLRQCHWPRAQVAIHTCFPELICSSHAFSNQRGIGETECSRDSHSDCQNEKSETLGNSFGQFETLAVCNVQENASILNLQTPQISVSCMTQCFMGFGNVHLSRGDSQRMVKPLQPPQPCNPV